MFVTRVSNLTRRRNHSVCWSVAERRMMKRPLVVLAGLPNDLLKYSSGLCRVADTRQICQRDDTGDLVVGIDDRHSPQLLVAHFSDGGFDRFVRPARFGRRRHNITDIALICAARCDGAGDDVSIGQNADNPIAVDNWQKAQIPVGHTLRGFANRLVKTNGMGVAGHDFMNFHVNCFR